MSSIFLDILEAIRSINSGIHIRLPTRDNENSLQSMMKSATPDLFTGEYQRPRTRSSVTVWNLPDTVLMHILRGIHVKDFLSFRSTHPYFRDLVDSNKSLWAHLSFSESWPNEGNQQHYSRASEAGNIEATIKLAMAYLYKEGLTKDDVSIAGHIAAQYLSRVEALTPSTFPFFWIFIRPPWSPDGSCCKVQAFNHIKTMVDQTNDRDLAFGVALTLKLQRLSVQGESKEEEQKYFKMAVTQNSAAAAFFSLLDILPDQPDKAKELERIRLFRQIASNDILEAKLNLMKCYTQGLYGGISNIMAQEYIQNFFKTSKPSGMHVTFSKGRTSDISRYILVDWLVEVVGMKDFSAHTLYLAVSMFDRFLQVRKVQRSQVQLLGVAAMVISSRFLGFDILTIREAAWLTDNSYSYHDVVRMMGELVSALQGNIRVLTIQDYLKVLVAIVNECGYAAMLVEYIAMLCLLQSEMGQYSPAEIAASCLLLSRLLLNQADPWPLVLQEWTGFSQDYLSLCTFHIHKKCLQEGSEVDYRDTKLQAVKIRYADVNRFSVSNIEVIGHKELCHRLGVTRLVSHGKNTRAVKFRNTDELIMSPRRGRGPDYSRDLNLSFEEVSVDRNHAATPPIKHSYILEEGISGYEGDLEEDSDESFSDSSDTLYELNEESDLDRSNAADTSDESKEWDNESSFMDHDTEDEEAKSLCDEVFSSVQKKSTLKSEIRLFPAAESRLACLSSMCHSRNNVRCKSSGSTQSSCICNCSCKQTYCSAMKYSETHDLGKTSKLSFSSPSLSSASESSSPSATLGIVQNARKCIPCGSIQTLPKSTRRDRLCLYTNSCDISHLHQGERSDEHAAKVQGTQECMLTQNKHSKSLRRSKSSQDLSFSLFKTDPQLRTGPFISSTYQTDCSDGQCLSSSQAVHDDGALVSSTNVCSAAREVPNSKEKSKSAQFSVYGGSFNTPKIYTPGNFKCSHIRHCINSPSSSTSSNPLCPSCKDITQSLEMSSGESSSSGQIQLTANPERARGKVGLQECAGNSAVYVDNRNQKQHCGVLQFPTSTRICTPKFSYSHNSEAAMKCNWTLNSENTVNGSYRVASEGGYKRAKLDSPNSFACSIDLAQETLDLSDESKACDKSMLSNLNSARLNVDDHRSFVTSQRKRKNNFAPDP